MTKEPEIPEDSDFIGLEIGRKDNLECLDCLMAAGAYRMARTKHPDAIIMITIGGYDEDPRELYRIPETKNYIQAWAKLANITDWRDAVTHLDQDTLYLLQMCEVFSADSPIYTSGSN